MGLLGIGAKVIAMIPGGHTVEVTYLFSGVHTAFCGADTVAATLIFRPGCGVDEKHILR